MPAKIRELDTRNVAAIVPGSDPKLKDEVVIFSAHWDHLGIGTPVNGDAIYNGAIDNGTGCGILLELARAWASLPQKPRRSALFLSVTAEEGGLRGSEYYAAHPLYPAARTAIDLNYDALYPWGRAKDVVLTGAERTTVWPLAQQIAKRLNLEISSDAQPEQGHYFRSDHFSFAHAGMPAFSIGHATEFLGKPRGLRPEDVGRVQQQALPPALGRIPGGLGFHRGPAGGRVRLRAGNGDRQPGQAARLAAGRPVPHRVRNIYHEIMSGTPWNSIAKRRLHCTKSTVSGCIEVSRRTQAVDADSVLAEVREQRSRDLTRQLDSPLPDNM